ncbi:CLUMA_CG017041, isoform A [Clunio marinus]|uniref:CLUMA_CG017041, isoform A n=1 Tax=Clunio marinus TaxID=568069 RepID=A0A1J1IUY4_9DIPT|nr:CLUMA_CG017041, isoform A [Clunio marinus]
MRVLGGKHVISKKPQISAGTFQKMFNLLQISFNVTALISLPIFFTAAALQFRIFLYFAPKSPLLHFQFLPHFCCVVELTRAVAFVMIRNSRQQK